MTVADIVQYGVTTAAIGLAVFITVKSMQSYRGDKYLCDNCKYNNDEACHKAERPRALDCAAYKENEPTPS